jgi:hypothetical protein
MPLEGLNHYTIRPVELERTRAFSCTGLAEMKERLTKAGLTFEERVIPRDGQTQLFLHDPDGIAVELNDPP